jgi:ABC-type uncharacterized transport system ATPase subunit
MLHFSKRFGALQALDDVSLTVEAGSMHALLGENGAGKSTLVKCLIGFYRADAGSVMVDGREREVASPRDAAALGLGMIFQHFTVVPPAQACRFHGRCPNGQDRCGREAPRWVVWVVDGAHAAACHFAA